MGMVGKGSNWKEIPEALWEEIAPLLPPPPVHLPQHGGRPRVCRRQVLTKILYVLRTGAQWNALDMLPGPSSSTAHRYYQDWIAAGVFQRLWTRALEVYDTVAGIVWEWLVVDGSLGKAPLNGEKTGPNPTDRAKSGVKRSVLTDGRGVPVGLALAGANRPDFQLLEETVASIPVPRPQPTEAAPVHLCADKGYDYPTVEAFVVQEGFTPHIPQRGTTPQAQPRDPEKRPRRWVVERTHHWLHQWCHVFLRWHRKAANYLAALQFAAAVIAFRAAGVLG